MKTALQILGLVFLSIPTIMFLAAGSSMGEAACHMERHRDCGILSIDRYINYHRE